MFWDTDPKSNLPVKMKLIVTSQCFIMVLDMASRDGIIVCRVFCLSDQCCALFVWCCGLFSFVTLRSLQICCEDTSLVKACACIH